MDTEEVGASAQIMQAFGALMPMLGQAQLDKTLTLPANPRLPKARRRNDKEEPDEVMQDPPQQHQNMQVIKLLTTVAGLVIRHDQELQNLRKMDQFIFF